MPEEKVMIVVVGRDQASKIFKTFAGEAEKAGKKVEKSFADKLRGTGKEMTKVGKKLSIGLTAPLVAFGAASVNSAMKAERLTNTLEGLSGGADEAATYIDAIKDASIGTISELDALAAANRALAFGIVETSDEMADMVEMAIVLGRAQGLDATTAVSDFSTALSRSSPLILDNLGLVLSISEANSIYAESLGKTVAELTEAEKAEAFRKAALIKGAELVEQMGGLQDDAAASAERMRAGLSDMTTQIGTALLPVMQQGLDIMGPLIQKFTEMDPATQKLVVGLGAAAAAAGPLLTVGGKLVGTFGDLFTAVSDAGGGLKGLSGVMNTTKGKMLAGVGAAVALYGAYKAIEGVLDDIEQGQREVNRALAGWVPEVGEAVKRGEDLEDVMGEMADRANQARKDLRVDGNLWVDVAAAIVRATSAGKLWNQMSKQSGRAALYAADNYADYLSAVEEYNYTVVESRAEIEAVDEATWSHQNTLYRYYEALKQADQMQREHNATLVTTGDGVSYAERHLEKFGRRVVDGKDALIRLTKAGSAAAAEAEAWAALIAEKHEAMTARAEAAGARRVAVWQEEQGAIADYISSLTGATEEEFRRTLLGAVDPKEVGVAAWAALGKELGLFDQKAVDLATSIEPMAAAWQAQIIPTENMKELLHEVFVNAGDVNFELGPLLDKYAEMPGLIGPSHEELLKWNDKLYRLGEVVAPSGEQGIRLFGDEIKKLPEYLQPAAEFLGGLNSVIQQMEGEHDVIINIKTNMEGPAFPNVPEYQFGGRIPGPVGAPQLVLAHGGEYMLNPWQRGAMGGPGGPLAPGNISNQYDVGGTHYHLYNQLAFSMAKDLERQKRFERLESLM